VEERKTKKIKTDMLRSISEQSRESRRKKGGCGGKDLQKRKVFCLECGGDG